MTPMSQAHEAIRDFTTLPEPCPPATWQTSEPGGPTPAEQQPFTFAAEPFASLRVAS